MSECSPKECPLEPCDTALEQANEQRGNTHREIFGRLNSVERDNAVSRVRGRRELTKRGRFLVSWKGGGV